MPRHRFSLLTIALACALAATAPVTQAADAAPAPMGTVERGQARRAAELLTTAVDYLKANGPEKAFAAFNDTKGPFVNGAYYVFAVGRDGFMHANGGSPLGLAGKAAIDLRDAAGKPLIRDLLEQAATSPTGRLEYHWRNPASNRVESKVSSYQKVGDVILCVGYYTPRASLEEAQDLLGKAVAFLKKSGPDAAFAAFNDPQGGFMHDDQYVFVIGLDDGRYRATGASPQLTGMDVRGLRDAAGKPLVQEMITLVQQKDKGTVDYMWRNPATNAVEAKHSLIQRVDQLILGVGYYSR
ncbi:cache domain-containing protein [Ideonella sp. A 288]|uniref:cache domain-containing protein n=1 Tax=Ideonella sp. A 288 TaxID=1962181 RepID=UPI000B4BA18B|nr:cache domain-containing protein [Ideonella sp. A 288]